MHSSLSSNSGDGVSVRGLDCAFSDSDCTDVAAVEGDDNDEDNDSLEPPEKEDDLEEIGLDTTDSEVVADDVGVIERAAGR